MAIKVAQYGLGEIGRQITELILRKERVELIGCVDIDPRIVGRDLGEIVSAGKLGIPIHHEKDSAKILREADVTVHATSSRLKSILPQLKNIADAGSDVVSSCEELSYPFHQNPEMSRRIDDLAKKDGVTILGTGVNPGFVMDALVVATSVCCQGIDRVAIHRIVDASRRRLALQKKIGAGMTREDFQKGAKEGRIGHVGLKESAWMIMDSLGWGGGKVQEMINPIITNKPVRSEYLEIAPGRVCGLDQNVSGWLDGREVVSLHLEMYVGATPKDSIQIVGRPSINLAYEGGIHGDMATTAIIYNMIPRVVEALAGLKTMRDMTLPRIYA